MRKFTTPIDWFHFTSTFPGKGLPEYDHYKQLYWELIRARTEHTLIFMENPSGMQRKTRVWDRGSWSTQKQVVKPDIPEIFYPFPEKVPRNRLGLLLQWIIYMILLIP